MKATSIYRLSWLFMLLLLAGCSGSKAKKVNWRISLDRKSKDPYGTFLAYQSLKNYFPGTQIVPLSQQFRYTSIDYRMGHHDSASLLVLLGLKFEVSEEELKELVSFAEDGNEVFILASQMDEKLEQFLSFKKVHNEKEEQPMYTFNEGKANEHLLTLMPDSQRTYGYPGRDIQGYFDIHQAPTAGAGDTSNTTLAEPDRNEESNVNYTDYTPAILGKAGDKPDFIRYSVGDGHITLHAAPLVMSNYFLLRNHNYQYLGGIWQTMPAAISHIYWNEYFKRRAPESGGIFSLLRFPPLRWAFLLLLLCLLVYVLFEGKRRQRLIPVIPPLENSSVSFVETIGRLYFNKGDHANLAEKMIQHFLEWVRSRYYLNTNQLDDHFRMQLAVKSGLPPAVAEEMLQMITDVRLQQVAIDEAFIFKLYQTIQQFYKNK